MLETIKAYATTQLDTRPDFADAARAGHAGYFAELARSGTTETDAAELDNLRIAWAYSVGRQDLTRLADLREALWPIYESRGWYHATIQLADDLLAVRASVPALRSRGATAGDYTAGRKKGLAGPMPPPIAPMMAQRLVLGPTIWPPVAGDPWT